MLRPRILDCEPIPGDVPETLYRDEDVWIVDKPAGWLTHSDGAMNRPAVTDWCGESVGIHQRLDVDTTGVLAMSRSRAGAARLQEAFENRTARKRYLAVVEQWTGPMQGSIRRPVPEAPDKDAETHYRVLQSGIFGTLMELTPVTGRRHQLRSHLAQMGAPIRGDGRYGDPLDRRAPRTLLHCASLSLKDDGHWESPAPAEFSRVQGGGADALRKALKDDDGTSCYREYHGEGDGTPGWYVDRYDDWLWVQHDVHGPTGPLPDGRGVYTTNARKDRSGGGQSQPQLTSGIAAPEELPVLEHGIRHLVRLGPQLSTGLFLDQRPQRTWLAQNGAGLRILNTFAHAGGFSIAAAAAGASTVSIDLSKAWIERIPRQLADHGIPPDHHDWIYGDVFQWMPKLAKRGERFDLIILDPPSTSVGKKKKRWSAKSGYPELVQLAAELLVPGGRLWTSTNHRGLKPREFARLVKKGAPQAELERVCPPGVDFPCMGPPNQKTLVWRWPNSSS